MLTFLSLLPLPETDGLTECERVLISLLFYMVSLGYQAASSELPTPSRSVQETPTTLDSLACIGQLS
jgi:hypothetical protein